MARESLTFMQALCFVVGSAGCGPAVKIDVDCKKLCLAVPGPTIPAIPSVLLPPIDGGVAAWDGGLGGILDSGILDSLPTIPSLEWVAEMDFNSVLAQLPSAAAGLSAEVQLASFTLASTTSLHFIDALEVSMRHGNEGATGKTPGSSIAATELADAGSGPSCNVAGFAMRVAYFQRSDSSPTGPTIDLVMVNPELNMFDCMRDEPTRFEVKLTSRLGAVPATDAPLTLGSCIGAATHVSFP